MRQDLFDKYDLRLPRYTSYPTAPHFSPAVDGDIYRRWLSELPTDLPLSLYLHVAYCDEMCWFCGCHTKITKKYDPIAVYLEAMLQEIDIVAEALPDRMTARHIHFGGGSPTILNAQDFVRLVTRLRERFLVAEDAEVAVELDPRTADEDYVKAMASVGVTRASCGVQDFNPKVQKAINRIQPYEQVAEVVGWLRKYDIPEVNTDLMYGLPYQTVDSVMETLDLAFTLNPSRISLFGYAHVPWMKKHQTLLPEDSLPGTEERWAQYDACQKKLAENGFVAVGFDHFAREDDDMAIALREGRLHRNFQGYTTDANPCLIGMGASGIGSLPQGYAVNDGGIHAYQRAVGEGRLATSRGIAVSAEDKLRRDVIERLMCDLFVDLDAIAQAHGRTGAHFAPEIAALQDLEADGILTRDGYRLTMTEDGKALVRAVCAKFDKYLKAGEQRHSKAV